ncbi:retinol dehydrogenase 12-like [Asbolus verrucosus]|uniref:Retinol dehydrogenase 12-like n=1 Tax=Asbolus verrucosus TaxID=1661398 RepID=A0A482VKE8_ASBVE|nr:retinol dehydrogenase 12-like [Asbolus verrucosus]
MMFKKKTSKPMTILNFKIPRPIFYASTAAAALGITCLIKEWTGGQKLQPSVLAEGKVVIVTGANTGIGRETALDLAKRKAKVYMACRDMSRCEAARIDIVLESNNKYVYCRKCDLASLESIREFVNRFKTEQSRLDILINNGGVMRTPNLKTKDGFEMQLGVNHLGHFLLTNLLLDMLKNSAPSRIINVSSVAHKRGKINKDDLNSDKNYDPGAAYAQSKLANILFTKELAKKLAGMIHNVILHDNRYWIFWPFIKSPKQGAYTVVYTALSSSLNNITGKYFKDCEETEVSEAAKDEITATWLWAVSEKWTRLQAA